MPEFIMNGRDRAANELDAFTLGYVEALFFTETECGTDAESHDPENESPLHGNCGFDDLAPETLEKVKADCERFQKENAELLALAYERDGYDSHRAGVDFWLTRNGHGAGFWDRDLDDIGDKLSSACGFGTSFSTVDAYLGDDSRVYLT